MIFIPGWDVYHQFYGLGVATTLGYTNPRKAIRDHTKGGTKRSSLIAGDNQKMTFVPEGDVYRLVAHSRLSSVERFERRRFGDVLPSIRKTGIYALLAIHVGNVAKRLEQTGMKIGSNPFFQILPEDRLFLYMPEKTFQRRDHEQRA